MENLNAEILDLKQELATYNEELTLIRRAYNKSVERSDQMKARESDLKSKLNQQKENELSKLDKKERKIKILNAKLRQKEEELNQVNIRLNDEGEVSIATNVLYCVSSK